jgi:hypothetical protein
LDNIHIQTVQKRLVPVGSSEGEPEDILYSELSGAGCGGGDNDGDDDDDDDDGGGDDAEVSDEAITLSLKRVLRLEIFREGVLFQ